MATAVRPLSAANTNTQMDDATLNPDIKANRQVVHITLVCDGGVTVNPDNIYDALDAQFGTVAAEKTTMSRGCWIFNLST